MDEFYLKNTTEIQELPYKYFISDESIIDENILLKVSGLLVTSATTISDQLKIDSNNFITYRKQKQWIKYAQTQLDEMRKLSDNWNGYGSRAPNNMALRIAQDIIDILHEMDFSPSRVTPSAEDGVSIIFTNQEKRAMVEVYNDGDIMALIYDNAHEKIWSISSDLFELKRQLNVIQSFIN